MVDPNQPFVGHIVLDIPAKKPALRFDQIARALATIVKTSPPQFAVGIFGGWGSGKSTLMNAIHRDLTGPETIVVEFNAWRYEREPHLIVPLLDTIRAGLAKWAGHPGVLRPGSGQVGRPARSVGGERREDSGNRAAGGAGHPGLRARGVR